MRAAVRLPLRTFTCKAGEFKCRHFLVFCDGAVRPSPYGWAGIGYSIFTDDGRFIEAVGTESKTIRRMGINTAEIWAAIRALSHVMIRFGPTGVSIHTDSAFLVRLANGNVRPRRDDVISLHELLRKTCDDHKWVTVSQVSRTHPKMIQADRLSKEGAALTKQRAQRLRTGALWQGGYSPRRFSRGYEEDRSKEVDRESGI